MGWSGGAEIGIKDLKSVGHTIHINVYDLSNKQFQELVDIAALGDLHSFPISSEKKNCLLFI